MSDTGAPLAIDVAGISKSFDGKVVVDNMPMRVRRGEIFGFLGPNGSGKTTFLRMLCGLLRPDAGEGRCLGFDIIRESDAIKRRVGYMTQRFSFYEDLSIEENLDFISRMYGLPNRRSAVAGSLKRLGMSSRRQQLAGTLSGGWKQRLSLAACLIHQPELLLLDEPTAGVDPNARREFWDEIHDLAGTGLTVLITTHYMDEAERCHRLAYIAYGKLLAQGTAAEITRGAGIFTWQVRGPGLAELAGALRASPAAEQVAAFGDALHVSGSDRRALMAAIEPHRHGPFQWTEIEPGLEDAFIRLMRSSEENINGMPPDAEKRPAPGAA